MLLPATTRSTPRASFPASSFVQERAPASASVSASSSGAQRRFALDGFTPAEPRRALRTASPALELSLAQPKPNDGKAFMKAALADIRERTARGEQVRVVFDIDDTLADNRGRTLALGKEFDTRHGTHYFDNATLQQMGKDGAETAQKLGLSAADAKSFNGLWKARFFDPSTNQNDAPMKEIIRLAQKAKKAGAQVFYLTGRTENGRQGTREELQRFGLPDVDDAHLVMKPSRSVSTPDYKAKQFGEWLKEPQHISWFITESRRDIAAIQAAQPEVPCVLLDSAKEHGGVPVRPDTPIYPSVTEKAPKPPRPSPAFDMVA